MDEIKIIVMFFFLILLLNGMAGCKSQPSVGNYVVTNDANGVYIRNIIPHGQTDRYLSEVERGVIRLETLQNCSDIFISQHFKKCGGNMNLNILRDYFFLCEKRFNPDNLESIDYEYFTACHNRWEYRQVTSQERIKLFEKSVEKLGNKIPKKQRRYKL